METEEMIVPLLCIHNAWCIISLYLPYFFFQPWSYSWDEGLKLYLELVALSTSSISAHFPVMSYNWNNFSRMLTAKAYFKNWWSGPAMNTDLAQSSMRSFISKVTWLNLRVNSLRGSPVDASLPTGPTLISTQFCWPGVTHLEFRKLLKIGNWP